MSVNITDATAYIESYCVFIDDWAEADDAKKQRILNVAQRTLATKYPEYVIPDNAVYEFANVLAQVWNDTVRYARQGVNQYTVSGVAQFGFKDEFVTTPDVDPADYIPQTALNLIGEANGVKLNRRAIMDTVM